MSSDEDRKVIYVLLKTRKCYYFMIIYYFYLFFKIILLYNNIIYILIYYFILIYYLSFSLLFHGSYLTPIRVSDLTHIKCQIWPLLRIRTLECTYYSRADHKNIFEFSKVLIRFFCFWNYLFVSLHCKVLREKGIRKKKIKIFFNIFRTFQNYVIFIYRNR